MITEKYLHLIIVAVDSEGIVGNISGPKVASVPLGKSLCHLTPLFLQELEKNGVEELSGKGEGGKWDRAMSRVRLRFTFFAEISL